MLFTPRGFSRDNGLPETTQPSRPACVECAEWYTTGLRELEEEEGGTEQERLREGMRLMEQRGLEVRRKLADRSKADAGGGVEGGVGRRAGERKKETR